MKLICVRHGKPEFQYPRGGSRMLAREFNQLLEAYDVAGLDPVWNEPHFAPAREATANCFSVSSDLSRALETGRRVLESEPDLISADYREIPLPRFERLTRRLPGVLFMALSRLGWYTGRMPGEENRKESLARVKRCATQLESLCADHSDVAVFAHGFFLWLLGRELVRRGWRVNPPGKRGPYGYLEYRTFLGPGRPSP